MNLAISHIAPRPRYDVKQFVFSIGLIATVSLGCYSIAPVVGYRSIALILLLAVSFIAMVCDTKPVLVSAALSALIWDFFFIPPKFTLHVDNAEDVLMLAMYLAIALLNAIFTLKIRKMEKSITGKRGRQRAIGLYNTLLSSLSHELRTPLSTIIAAADNLKSTNAKLSEQNKEELLEEISKASLRLNEQVENLLNMSRLESGIIQVKKDWCDMNDLVHVVVNRLKENAPTRIVNVVVKEDTPLVKVDIDLIEQILHNLILNAFQYIPKYCVVTVRVSFKVDKMILVVEDNGDGFPEDERDKVFEKFYRLKNSITGGTGLGLSIVKGFVEAHNGTIKLENVIGGGTRFTMEIPTEITNLIPLE